MITLIIFGIAIIVIALLVYRVYQRSEMAQDKRENQRLSQAFMEKNRHKEKVIVLPSGLQYEVLSQHTSQEKPSPTDNVKVHYEGYLINGKIFDSSMKRRRPAVFALNRVIKGWTEGLQLMSVGDIYRFYIPAQLGYGNRWSGNIPPASVLIFDVELLAINPE